MSRVVWSVATTAQLPELPLPSIVRRNMRFHSVVRRALRSSFSCRSLFEMEIANGRGRNVVSEAPHAYFHEPFGLEANAKIFQTSSVAGGSCGCRPPRFLPHDVGVLATLETFRDPAVGREGCLCGF